MVKHAFDLKTCLFKDKPRVLSNDLRPKQRVNLAEVHER